MGIKLNNKISLEELKNLDESQREAVFANKDNIVIHAPAGAGKALRNGTKVLSKEGWKPIEKLTTKDFVCGSDGLFHKVLGVYPQGKKQVYRVAFSDGTIIDCSPDHLWSYYTDESDGRMITTTTDEIDINKNPCVPAIKPVIFNEEHSDDFDYYNLGVAVVNEEVDALPEEIFTASRQSRASFISGFFAALNTTTLSLKSEQLIKEIQSIFEGMGYVVSYTKNNYWGTFELYVHPKKMRFIRHVFLSTEWTEMTCIEVDSFDHLFVTEHCIPTHNTTVLISAIANYRYEHMNDKICAITFTRAARQEMKDRLKKMGIYDIDVTTIHVWCRNILNELKVKWGFKVEILTNQQQRKIVEEIVRRYTQKAKVRRIDIDAVIQFINGNKNMNIADNLKRTYRAIDRRYVQYKRNNMLYDFGDWPLFLYDVLTEYNEQINNIDALFVDELQDISSIELSLFNKVNANYKFFIGDKKQSIYVFRGSDGKVFNKLDNFDSFNLKYNYRSYQEIIDYASTVYDKILPQIKENEDAEKDVVNWISKINFSVPSSVICNKGYGGKVVVTNPYGATTIFKNSEANSGVLEDELKIILDKNPMILCRTNKQVYDIQENAIYSAQTIHQAKGLEYDDVILIDFDINSIEDLNIAYVGLTRAKNSVMIINWNQFTSYALKNYISWQRLAW